ncbi:HNH endonuclease [Hymenobacter fodinae]|uniref:HNH endonuclease n=1 Tax=Hymenobacter fodinae TaxID=2510796 RepID=A0A4Z0PBB4_9BACT|nr:HNH endonuclease [Hymenobacter fodinae]
MKFNAKYKQPPTKKLSKAGRAKKRRKRRIREGPRLLPDPTPRPDENCPEWQALKAQVLREERRCRTCRTKFRLTVDHIIPLSLGGGNHRANLQCLCYRCNMNKGADLPAPAPDLFPLANAA